MILTPKEEKVLELRSQGLTLEQVGKQLNLTRQRVSQLERKANFKLDNSFDLNEFKKKIKRLELIEKVLKGEYDYIFEKDKDSILDKPLQDLGLSVRAYNCLMRYFTYGCIRYNKQPIDKPKVKDLCDLTELDLMKVKNLGLKSLKEIEDKLESLGLYLMEENDD